MRRAEPLVLGLSPTLLLPRRLEPAEDEGLEPAEDEDLEPDLKPARGSTPTAGGGAGRAEAEAAPPVRVEEAVVGRRRAAEAIERVQEQVERVLPLSRAFTGARAPR